MTQQSIQAVVVSQVLKAADQLSPGEPYPALGTSGVAR